MKISVLLSIFSIFLYVLACVLVGYTNKRGYEIRGVFLLIVGFFSFMFGIKPFLAWTSNIFYFSALLIFYFLETQILISLIISAIALGLSFFALGVKKMLLNEGGDSTEVSPDWGLYCWIASFGTFFITNVIAYSQN